MSKSPDNSFTIKNISAIHVDLMIIGQYGDGVSGSSRSSTPATLASDPVTCPIIPGCETTIDISKGRTGLGLSIVGGCDTLLVSMHNGFLYERVRKKKYTQPRPDQSCA